MIYHAPQHFGEQFSLDVEPPLSYNIGWTGIRMEIILFLFNRGYLRNCNYLNVTLIRYHESE